MLKIPYNYNIFFDFVELHIATGFLNINPSCPVLQKIEELMNENSQFFSIRDMSQIKYLFTSSGSKKILGVEPCNVNSGFFKKAVHPSDRDRLGLGKTHMMRVTSDIYTAKSGNGLMSYTLRFMDSKGRDKNLLGQSYFFYSSVPYNAVFMLQVVTDVSWNKKINNDGHHYVGNDLSLFRFPDEELLKVGSVLTKRELQVVKLIARGLSSKEIAQKIFLSVATVNTHRYNIAQKTEMAIPEVIIDMQNRGLL